MLISIGIVSLCLVPATAKTWQLRLKPAWSVCCVRGLRCDATGGSARWFRCSPIPDIRGLRGRFQQRLAGSAAVFISPALSIYHSLTMDGQASAEQQQAIIQQVCSVSELHIKQMDTNPYRGATKSHLPLVTVGSRSIRYVVSAAASRDRRFDSQRPSCSCTEGTAVLPYQQCGHPSSEQKLLFTPRCVSQVADWLVQPFRPAEQRQRTEWAF